MSDKVDKLAAQIKAAHPNKTHREVKQKAAEAFRRTERRNKK